MQVEEATTWLFVPGSRPDRFERALGSDADVVIVDLEDAVAAADKDAARTSVGVLLSAGARVVVRINPAGTPWYVADLGLVAAHPCVVMLPKTESPEAVAAVAAVAAHGVLPMVESAAGIVHAPAIASVPAVRRLVLGNADLAQQLGVSPDDRQALLGSRSQLVLASAYADLPAPVDGVTLSTTDADLCASEARHGRSLGFGGKLCIHPNQLAAVRAGYRPLDDELAWARSITSAASGAGVSAVDGLMIDRPVVLRAERLLAQEASWQASQRAVRAD